MTASNRPMIVIPGDEPVQLNGSAQLERLKDYGAVTLYDNRPQTNEEKIRRARDADVMINSRGAVKWPGEVLRELPKLRFITVREMGIIVSNIPGKTAPVVSEHGLALMLAAAKRIAFQTAEMKAGRWTRMDNIFLNGKTLGIVGTGPIGAAMARLGRAIGMDVIAWTFHPSDERAAELGVRYVELDELLKTSDVVSLHVKSTPQTHYLIGARELAMMKPNSLLVNTARGAILDTAALIDALNRGHLGGAGIDVYETEPSSAPTTPIKRPKGTTS
jgi:phosphoglycerate dehydrogenase-like enzyme